MRILAGMVVLAAQVACAASPTDSAVTRRIVAPSPPGPGPAMPAMSAVARVTEPTPVSPGARALAEVGAMDTPSRWAWAVAAMPSLARHREEDPGPAAWAEFRRRAAGRRTLWVRTRGARCFSARGEWEEDWFIGHTRVTTKIDGDTKTAEYELVEIHASSIMINGPHGESFTRDARGRWQPSGGYGFGCMAVLAERPVHEVRGGAAYYGGLDYTVTVKCVARVAYAERCADGSTRRCERCGGLVDQIHAEGLQRSGSSVGWSADVTPRDCSQPCPPDVHGARVEALALAVAGRRFHGAEAPEAAVYTSRQACEGDRRMARRLSRGAGR
jgi:hypothetical protein